MPRAAVLGAVVVLLLIAALFASLASSWSSVAAGVLPPGQPSRDSPFLGPSPAFSCSPNNGGLQAQIVSAAQWNGSTNRSWAPVLIGLAPATGNFTVIISGAPEVYSYGVEFGDGSTSTGSVQLNASGTTWVNVSHVFDLPATYFVNAWVNYTCPAGPGSNGSGAYWGLGGPEVLVSGPGGYYPVTVTVQPLSGTVPLTVNYTADINDTPANVTIEWSLANEFQSTSIVNETSFNYTWDSPGPAAASVTVYYTQSGLLYGQAAAPGINVDPLVNVSVSQSAAIGYVPTTITFFANVTNLNGTAYGGPGTIDWDFNGSIPRIWNSSPLQITGPTVGPVVTENFTIVASGSWEIGFPVTASLVLPGNLTAGWGYTEVTISTGGQGSGPPPDSLTMTATPSSGPAPFDTNLTLTAAPTLPSNDSIYSLSVCVTLVGAAWNSCGAFGTNVSGWDGAPLGIPVTGLTAGTYFVGATLSGPGGPYNSTVWADANLTLGVSAGSPAGGLAVSASGSAPANGTAPETAQVEVGATGGSSPYQLTLCLEGPSPTASVSGSCATTAGVTGWNGSVLSFPVALNASGYYLVDATVTDANGTPAVASIGFDVGSPPIAAPLVVHASDRALASGAGTYEFVATIQGGVAPYTVQWTFGDGSYGSSVPGGTATHAYGASGTYTATLTVTDAAGTVMSSSVGPLVVTLPTTSGTSPLTGATLGIAAASAAVVVASLVVIGYVVRTAAERRRTQSWLDSLGPGPRTEEPPSKPGP